jgi:hypothetical protein
MSLSSGPSVAIKKHRTYLENLKVLSKIFSTLMKLIFPRPITPIHSRKSHSKSAGTLSNLCSMKIVCSI